MNELLSQLDDAAEGLADNTAEKPEEKPEDGKSFDLGNIRNEIDIENIKE